MPRKIVIVGAVALGPKVACRARRLDPDAEITMIDRDTIISYGGCGIPYYVSGDIPEVDELFSTIYHAVRDQEFFKTTKRVDVRTATEVTAIDRAGKKVKVRDLKTDQEEELEYDALVLATGATPFTPPVPGVGLPGVEVIANLHHAVKIKDRISAGEIDSAVVVGGGAIGLEMAEALSALWGIETTLVEMLDQVLPGALCPELAKVVQRHLEENEIRVLTGCRVEEILGDEGTGVRAVRAGCEEIPAQLVIFGVGARPTAWLAENAGLTTGPFGGILVDGRMRTSDPHIYAGGDCVEIRNLVTSGSMHLPLGSLANRQGRVIGTNVCGGNERFRGAVGAFCLKAFELGVAKAGLTERQAGEYGFDPASIIVAQSDKAHFYPGSKVMFMKLIAERKTRRVIGVEAVGENGDAVKARVDAVAALLRHGPDLDDISTLEVGYAPPFASAMDIVNTAGNALSNVLDGFCRPMDPFEFLAGLEGTPPYKVLDVRAAKEAEPYLAKYPGIWLNIPQDELAGRLGELPGSQPLAVFCNTGVRSYECAVLLRDKGFEVVGNVQGGFGLARELNKDFGS
jgi:NADPH-dependent 2,4-dienoyl-CoA reductase/sulfur reductase-like enzyme/rhodanese-related sulfurtransferase